MENKILGPVGVYLKDLRSDEICGYCLKELKGGWGQAIAPTYYGMDPWLMYSVHIPRYHHKCSDLMDTLECIRGLEKALQRSGAKRTRKTKKYYKNLVDHFYKEYEAWKVWYKNEFNEDAPSRFYKG